MAKKYYYNIFDDLAAYPDAWAYMVVGGRSTGKTYGALKGSYLDKIKFIFAKRTADDVNLMCSGTKMIKGTDEKEDPDFSPFAPINRDLGCNIKAYQLYPGLGVFYDTYTDENGKSISIRMVFSDPEKTLTRDEVMEVANAIIESLEKNGIMLKK